MNKTLENILISGALTASIIVSVFKADTLINDYETKDREIPQYERNNTMNIYDPLHPANPYNLIFDQIMKNEQDKKIPNRIQGIQTGGEQVR